MTAGYGLATVVIRFVGCTRNHVPNVIMYSDTQIMDIETFCFGCGSVLSFDRTFNLANMNIYLLCEECSVLMYFTCFIYHLFHFFTLIRRLAINN